MRLLSRNIQDVTRK